VADECDGLRFEKWEDTDGDSSVQDIINSTELRAASSTPLESGLHFTMAREKPIEPAFKPPLPPPVRRSGRYAAVEASAPPPAELVRRCDLGDPCGCACG